MKKTEISYKDKKEILVPMRVKVKDKLIRDKKGNTVYDKKRKPLRITVWKTQVLDLIKIRDEADRLIVRILADHAAHQIRVTNSTKLQDRRDRKKAKKGF